MQAWRSRPGEVQRCSSVHSDLHPYLLPAGVYYTPALLPWALSAAHRHQVCGRQAEKHELQVSFFFLNSIVPVDPLIGSILMLCSLSVLAQEACDLIHPLVKVLQDIYRHFLGTCNAILFCLWKEIKEIKFVFSVSFIFIFTHIFFYFSMNNNANYKY